MEINKKTNFPLINQFKIQIKKLKKERMISNLENLIVEINKKGLLMGLFSLKVIKKESVNNTEQELSDIINKIYIDLYKKNPILFKLELYMPKLYEFSLEQLIVWIYKVELKQEKIKKDEKKQFFYLIYQFQNAQTISEQQSILLKLLKKFQLYLKNVE